MARPWQSKTTIRRGEGKSVVSTKHGLLLAVLLGIFATVIFASNVISNLNYNLPLFMDHMDLIGNISAAAGAISAPVVGYAITVSGCSPPKHGFDHVVSLDDAAAVLKHSIHAVSSRVGASQYDYAMHAFVHPEADHCASETLRAIGFDVQLRETPINVTAEITNEDLQRPMLKQGCCGDKELLKFFSLQLTQYPIVVHMDLDSILLQPLDHLFDIMLSSSTSGSSDRRDLLERIRQHHDGENETHIIQRLHKADPPNEITTMFSRDYAMAVDGTKSERVGMQGGFWIVKPSLEVFDDFMDTIRAQNYVSGCGWGGCQYGRAWFFGAANFQGLVSYYYSQLQEKMHPTQTYVELDRCKYNNMADPKREGCRNGKDTAACDDCFDTPLEQIHGAHFTLCQKPYWCPTYPKKSKHLCYQFHRTWHLLRQDWEERQKLEPPYHHQNFSLRFLWPPPPVEEVKSYEALVESQFPGHCPKRGDPHYIPINFHNIIGWKG